MNYPVKVSVNSVVNILSEKFSVPPSKFFLLQVHSDSPSEIFINDVTLATIEDAMRNA